MRHNATPYNRHHSSWGKPSLVVPADLATRATSLLGLVPSVFMSRDVDISAAVKTYKDDLPSPELLPLEMKRWEQK